jgi:hypothetical protein
MPATTTGGGTYFAMPDTCKTPAPPAPPIPIPYPNTAQAAMATGTTTKVMIMNMPCVAQGAKIPLSSGDEAGVAGGVVSGQNMGPVEPKQFSSKVKLQGKGATFVTAMAGHNGTSANAPAGTQVAPSQTKVMVAP